MGYKGPINEQGDFQHGDEEPLEQVGPMGLYESDKDLWATIA